jgi:hypothetical protein
VVTKRGTTDAALAGVAAALAGSADRGRVEDREGGRDGARRRVRVTAGAGSPGAWDDRRLMTEAIEL